jgi:outer membrane protein
MKQVLLLTSVLVAALWSAPSYAQKVPDSLLSNATLQACVQYALQHQPVVKQSQIDESITEESIKSKLADWYPQLGLNAAVQHYLQVPSTAFNGQVVQAGVANTSSAAFQLTQNIFNRDLLLANNTAKQVRNQAKQNTQSNLIDVVTNVSKAYYDMLLTQQQMDVLDQNIVLLERSLKDAYNQYQSGIVDKTDYKRATISLNNTKAERKSAWESLAAKEAYLKQLMGYPENGKLDIVYDTMQMTQEVQLDTTVTVTYENRIEYQQLETTRNLLRADVQYNKWAYVPNVSAFASYTFAYLNSEFSKLYNDNYPNSLFGLQLSLPIFQGSKRIHNIRQAELQLKRTDYDVQALRSQINTEYTQAMASYKANLNEYLMLKENMELAKEVYDLLEMQYREGIKTYLEVITAQTDLRTAQLNYYNAMYTVLSSKIDLQKALGTVATN